jgi:hypothetical protein
MMRSYQASHGGLVLFTAPTRRQKIVRRRLFAVSTILSIALAAGLIGYVSNRHPDPYAPAAFSFFPSE